MKEQCIRCILFIISNYLWFSEAEFQSSGSGSGSGSGLAKPNDIDSSTNKQVCGLTLW